MNLSNDNTLCRPCSKVNFQTLIKGRTNYTARAGEYDEFWDALKVLNERHCPLCRLLRSCLRDVDSLEVGELGKLDQICGSFVDRELQIFIYRQGRTIGSKYSIQHCSTENQEWQQSANIEAPSFNPEELKSWLVHCNETHEPCKPSTGISENKHIPGFRLIDVKRGCIVPAEPTFRYCALSYVWGKIDQVVLTKSNLVSLEREQALFGKEFVPPRTIRDAIKLCQDIGETYLWVDSLCIVQDEKMDKLIQIRSMDTVYNQAFLTIVAAAGDDADSGLPPFNSPRSESDALISIEAILGNYYVSSVSPVIASQAITASKWATRGWTLQEFALSKRVVIFTGQYVFYRCENSVWGEDFGLNLPYSSDKGAYWDLPLERLSSEQTTPWHGNNTYSRLVTEYVLRVLTDENDILNAFFGILSRLHSSTGPEIWGLPSKEFGAALLWLSFSSNRRESFPSWSWTGWSQHVVLGADMYRSPVSKGIREFDCGSSGSAITCFRFDASAKIIRFEENNTIDRIHDIRLRAIESGNFRSQNAISVDEGFRTHCTPPSDHEHALNSYASNASPSGPPLSHYVFFWTSFGKLWVNRHPHDIWKDDPTHGIFYIYAKAGLTLPAPYVGFARLNIAWRAARPEMLEFAVTAMGVESYTGLEGHDRALARVKLRLILIERCGGIYGITPTYHMIPGVFVKIDQVDWIRTTPEKRLLALV